MLVIDTSVAIKWFFEDENDSSHALRVLEKLTRDPDSFFIPDLFFFEFSAVLAKKSNHDTKFCIHALENIYQLGLQTIPSGKELFEMAIQYSSEYKLTVYDCIYIATAKFLDAKWLTADLKALKNIPKSLGLSLQNF